MPLNRTLVENCSEFSPNIHMAVEEFRMLKLRLHNYTSTISSMLSQPCCNVPIFEIINGREFFFQELRTLNWKLVS